MKLRFLSKLAEMILLGLFSGFTQYRKTCAILIKKYQ